ncbi:cytochrome c [Paracoccus stylophorae]|uniref:Cytochrome c n=1 Tax=Paracoccus stylophorae TaxID=659350 RepID=A0ABY7SVI5_9RHOB|nr:cytochrome c [Paracoccus stylophorae]WCR11042.1 cytochrome c [Paracoccus stylophorae]
MRLFLRIVAGLVLLGLLVVVALILWPLRLTAPERLTVADDAMAWPAVEKEDYPRLAVVAADCAACHTADDGARFAGGRAFPTPMGTIYSSNITPDDETGIGGYTLDEFRAALVDGVRGDGAHLYPAMPYTNYRKLAERDVAAIYDYMMNQVEPVRNTPPEDEMTFPFNLRFGIRAWKWVSLPRPGFTAASDDPVLARGAYLVEGPEHCGACHSPRNALFVQSGYDASDPDFLSGGELNGWPVPSLRGEDGAPATWSEQALTDYLRTGRNAASGVGGEMTLVVEHSLQELPDSDVAAIVAYLRALAPNGGGSDDGLLVTADGTRAGALRDAQDSTGTIAMLSAADPDEMELGARLYLDNCSGCHFSDGDGSDSVVPRLDGNRIVNADSPVGLIKTILDGAELPSTHLAPYALAMPGFADRLDDAEVAELASFVRRAWSNDAPPVEADAIGQYRE